MMSKSQKTILSLINEENNKAEVFASYAQLIFLVFILILYILAPKGFSGNYVFEPVKLAFYFYFPLMVVRTYLAVHSKLRQWHIFIFLFFDVTVLTVLIWSFHIQYAAPLTLSLRSPTFLYFFVFLALRSLSFHFSHALFLVGSFLSMWSVMVWLALRSKELQLTRNFKDYLKPNTFILGVEIDKMLAVSLMGIIIAVSTYRKRRLLLRLAENFVKEAAMQSLVGKGSLSSFNLLENELSPGQIQRRTGATMLVDLRGFSRLSYVLSSEELLVMLGEYQQIVAQRVFDAGGIVDKYLGDGILAHFGIANELPLYASSAVRAAELINEDLATWTRTYRDKGVEIGFGIAITHGDVAFGVIGHKDKMEITVLGESVNLAAKLEKHTKILGHPVAILSSTFHLAVNQGYLGKISPIEYKVVSIEGIPDNQNIFAFPHA